VVPRVSAVPLVPVVLVLVLVPSEPATVVPAPLPDELVSPSDPEPCVVSSSLVPLEVAEQFSSSSR
jgi:hypothetical protein